MKYFVILFSVVVLAGCAQQNKDRGEEKQGSNNVNYGAQLFESDFLEFADTLKFDSLKWGLLNSFDIYNEHNNKIADIDAEELAEFNFRFLPGLKKMLAKRDFKLDVRTAVDYERTNGVLINGEKIQLYTKEELENGNFWDSASKKFFKEINKQLNDKREEEVFYLLYSGNNLHVLLLTEKQHRIIAAKYKNDVKEIPYLP